jgi:adenosylcobyric acid synthase
VFHAEKTVRCVQGRLRGSVLCTGPWRDTSFQGYEIHVGETCYEPGAQPFADILFPGVPVSVPDGAVSSSGRVFGTYIHGLFDCDDFRHAFIDAARAAAGLVPTETWVNVAAQREARINRLANHLRNALNIGLIKSWIVEPSKQELEYRES